MLSYREVHLTVKSFVKYGHIYIYDVSVLEDGGCVRNTMTQHLVERGAAGSRESVEAQG